MNQRRRRWKSTGPDPAVPVWLWRCALPKSVRTGILGFCRMLEVLYERVSNIHHGWSKLTIIFGRALVQDLDARLFNWIFLARYAGRSLRKSASRLLALSVLNHSLDAKMTCKGGSLQSPEFTKQ